MKGFSIRAWVLTVTLLLSACGAKATPTPAVSVADMQNTAAAVALTMVAETQTALPTATPIPPTAMVTNTPPPTNTLLPLPFAEVTFTPAPSGSGGSSSGSGGDCINKVLPNTLQGEKVKIRINNSTKAAVAVTVYLNQTTPVVECGYRAYSIDAGQSIVISDMVEGCYTLWAWNPDQDNYFIVTNGASSCIDSSYQVAFDISTRDIKQR